MRAALALVVAGGAMLVACSDPDPSGAVPPEVASIPTTNAVPSTGTPSEIVAPSGPFDPDAAINPDLMVLEPAVARPGEHVTVAYPGGRDRGVAYVLERLDAGTWHTTHFMTATTDSPDLEDGEPSWVEFGTPGHGWEAIGISGPGPDALVIPDHLPPGGHRICTANSVENICARITIVSSEAELPFDRGTSAPVTDLLGLPLHEFTARVVERGFGPVRITWRDGAHQAVDADLRPGRVNVAVEQRDGVDVVIDARVEADTDTGWPGGPATIVEMHEGVDFYPACGNEQLELDGVVWYQVQQSEYPEIYDRAVNGDRENVPERVRVQGFAPRVAPPGRGDDVGTLVVWSDDVAYFVSDSGELTAWLVRDELSYAWEC